MHVNDVLYIAVQQNLVNLDNLVPLNIFGSHKTFGYFTVKGDMIELNVNLI